MTASCISIDSGAEQTTSSPRTIPAAVAFLGTAAAFAGFFVAAGAPTPLLPIYEQQWRFAPWLLTLAFGAYAIGLLSALLVLGRLSDFVGRRPVLLAALGLEVVSMVMFLTATDVGWLIAARIVQGIATGAATAAFSAAIIELAPHHRKKQGAILGGAAPAGGLALGALLAGAVAQFDTAAAVTVWAVLTALMATATVFMLFVPETTTRRPGAITSMRPQIAVPPRARRQFAVTVPTLVGGWMMAALFMGLMPIILGTVFHLHSPLVAGATSFITPAAATITSILGGRVTAHRLAIAGGVAVIVGAVAVVGAIVTATMPLLWLAGAVGGAGFGATFSGNVRLLTEDVDAHRRAGLFSAVFLVAYLAFGVPAILAGVFVAGLGIAAISMIFAAVIAVASSTGVVGQLRVSRAGTARDRALEVAR
jgi:MFS family permease